MAREEVEGTIEKAKGAVVDLNGNGVVGALKSKELLASAALSAAGAIAAAKGPDLVRWITDKTEETGENEARNLGEKVVEGAKTGLTDGKGGPGGLVGKAMSKALPGGGGMGGGGGDGSGKKTRRLPIQRWTDVAVPVDKAYEAWIKFDEYPKFMHRVLSVEKKGQDKISWQEKIWFSKRQWEGRITERRKNDRIVWKTTSGTNHKGIVSFHKLDTNLTRVMVEMEFEPTGMIEKMASGLRFVKRAVQADLARFKAYVEMQDAKGLEYSSARGGDDDKKDEEKKDKEQDQSEEQDADQNPDGDGERRGQTERPTGASRSSATPRTRSSTSRGGAPRPSARPRRAHVRADDIAKEGDQT
jgi:uncharacterized membrane protein